MVMGSESERGTQMHSVQTRGVVGKAEIIVNKQGVISQVIRDRKLQKTLGKRGVG